MRMRKKKNLDARLGRVAGRLTSDPRSLKGHWGELSGGRPIWLEIGCGKGRFAVGTAKAHPEAFVVAAEIEENVIVMALEAAAAAEVENLRFIHTDAEALDGCFAPGEVARVYLNFSDPWPRSPYRRLTSERFLAIYARILAEGGELRFKSDNRKLFDWSEEEFKSCGWIIDELTRDLHASELDGGVVTEYEERFSAMGTPINYLSARPAEYRRESVVEFVPVESDEDIERLVRLAEPIWREHYTPLIGKKQVAYMLEKFQSASAMTRQIREEGYEYRILTVDGADAGYIGSRREGERVFLSKFYIDRRRRGRGFSKLMLGDLIRRSEGLASIYLTCNRHNESCAVYEKLGFEIVDSVVTDIGGGFVMDDYVFELKLN